MSRYYIGLAVSGHDPAFSIVDEAGCVCFAEATERHLQDKRAWSASPDNLDHVAAALAEHCTDGTEFVIASSWAKAKPSVQELSGFQHQQPIPPRDTIAPFDPVTKRWSCEQQRQAFHGAGRNLSLLLGIETEPEVRRYDHHLCHAIYACADAPFDDGHCMVIDGEGEVGAVSAYRLERRRLTRRMRSWGPGSLGAYYAWLTNRCGFDWRLGEEWKVMGLAALGTPRPEVMAELERLLTIDNGKPIAAALSVWSSVGSAIAPYGKKAGQPVTIAADLAASGQAVYARLATQLLTAQGVGMNDRLVLTGGCALNSAFNGTLRTTFGLAEIHVPSAPGDDGTAIGAALLAWQEDHPDEALPRHRIGAYLGSEINRKSLELAVQRGRFGSVLELGDGETAPVAELLASGATIGVMRGRAEFGPRALGHRSILADPRSRKMKEILNRRVKGREPYRPFAPVVRAEEIERWFEHPQPSPYMSFTLPWREAVKEQVAAVVHEDGSGRLQSVSSQVEPWLHHLVDEFAKHSGVPVLLNTSFNVMGKPIVHRVEDALSVLVSTGLDAVLLDHILICKQ